MGETWQIRQLTSDQLDLISEIDRSEYMEVEYSVIDGALVSRAVQFDVPTWSREGTGEHSVATRIESCRHLVDRGAVFLGAMDGEEMLGIVVVEGSFEPRLAWCAFLHVTRPHRRRGIATALWNEAVRIGAEAGADQMYVSATPSGSAVGFYLSRGCRLAEQPHPDLFALEPEDIHLVCPIA